MRMWNLESCMRSKKIVLFLCAHCVSALTLMILTQLYADDRFVPSQQSFSPHLSTNHHRYCCTSVVSFIHSVIHIVHERFAPFVPPPPPPLLHCLELLFTLITCTS